MTQFFPLRQIPTNSPWKSGDHLVLFGELFQRGYANGLVEEAQKMGMNIIKGTVGRREKNILRPLNSEELAIHTDTVINIPLEAGFDMDLNSKGLSPVDYLKEVKLSEWEHVKLDWELIEESRIAGITRFKKQLKNYFFELEKVLVPGKNVLFAHLMAGGVPRAKIIMPLMNRVFKGTDERYLESEQFWNSDLGKLCQLSFLEVTAETYRYLIELSEELREKVIKSGGHVSYLAYGYHGTEVLINNQPTWQTYTPYLQGWAKKSLESISTQKKDLNINTCVYNCPEILTNSSSIFKGVEVSLYPLLTALKNTKTQNAQKILNECTSLLKKTTSLEEINNILDNYLSHPEIKATCEFSKWPQHSSKKQLEIMLSFSDQLIDLHENQKNLITGILSEVVFRNSGYIMLHDSWNPKKSVAWIGHDIIALCENVTN